MFKHTFRGFLYTPADELPGAGGDPAPPSGKIDMGAAFEHGDPGPAKEAPKLAEKSDVEKRLDALERDNKAKDARINELTESERYWAQQARGKAPAPEEVPADPDEDEPPLAAADPFEGEKPDKFLDDLSVDGLKALLKRGVITQEQFVAEVGNVEKRLMAKVEEKLATNTRHQQIDQQLAKFPDLQADAARVAAGQTPQTELYKRTQVHFRQMVADDAGMKSSPAALLAAARMAQKEIDLEAKAQGAQRTDRQVTRRERIENLMPDRDRGGEGGSEEDQLSPNARNVVNALSRFGVTEESFRQFANEPAPTRNGRRN